MIEEIMNLDLELDYQVGSSLYCVIVEDYNKRTNEFSLADVVDMDTGEVVLEKWVKSGEIIEHENAILDMIRDYVIDDQLSGLDDLF